MVARADGPERGAAPTHAQTKPRDGELRRTARIEPSEAEVESARSLANEARQALRARGIAGVMIDRLAIRYIAEGRGDAVDEFIEWADTRARGSRN